MHFRLIHEIFEILNRFVVNECDDKTKVSIWIAHEDAELDELIAENRIVGYARKEISKLIENCKIASKKAKAVDLETKNTDRSAYRDYDSRLDKIFHYFDAKTAVYFAFLEFYTSWLWIPGVGGLAVVATSVYDYCFGPSTYRQSLLPFICILSSLWSSCFLEFWKRQYNTLEFKWRDSISSKASVKVSNLLMFVLAINN